MNCVYQKSALDAVTVPSQTLTADGYVDFESNRLQTGCSVQHVAGSNTVNLINHGLYLVSVNADIVPATAEPITL